VTKRSKPSLPDTPEQAIAFLCERRAEALDALLALRGARKKLPDSPIEPPKAVKPPLEPILPKRALSLAGYWNIMPNDLLAVTPALIEAIEAERGDRHSPRGDARMLLVEGAGPHHECGAGGHGAADAAL